MTAWRPRAQELKRYPHFDRFIAPDTLEQIATDPVKVAQNAFYPFIRYTKRWRPFRDRSSLIKYKERPIRYASRRDACIFSYYRYILSQLYEQELQQRGITECPIAYRRLPAGDGRGRGKCNIDFASDAFNHILELGDCVVIALDVSSYFEVIDHRRLRELWIRLLKCETLPADHAAVFKAITNYAFVDRDELYMRLGYIGPKATSTGVRQGYLIPRSKMRMQLCSPRDFRERVCGDSGTFASMIEKNQNPFGIPQGAPISDLLSNLYLIDFDQDINNIVSAKGGVYFRYSDDILLIVPENKSAGVALRDAISEKIREYGDHLSIKKEKCAVVQYTRAGEVLRFELVEGNQGKNGLEYLRFRFDGKYIFLRDATLSRYYRKITFAARQEAKSFVARYRSKSVSFLLENFHYDAFTKRFGRVEDFENQSDCRNWTFWTYARRAAEIMGPKGRPILQQISRHRTTIRRRLEYEIQRAAAAARS